MPITATRKTARTMPPPMRITFAVFDIAIGYIFYYKTFRFSESQFIFYAFGAKKVWKLIELPGYVQFYRNTETAATRLWRVFIRSRPPLSVPTSGKPVYFIGTSGAAHLETNADQKCYDVSNKKPMSQMLREITEQPEVLEKTIRAESGKYAKLKTFLRARDVDLIVLVARGSSDNAALLGRYLLEITTGIPVSLSAPAVYTLYKADLKLSRALVVGISQSGEGVDINQVLEAAKKSGAFTLGITNEAASTMAKIVDETLLIHAGREKSVAATKTYTGQMLHFYLLASILSDEKIEFEKIPQFTSQALELKPQIEELVQRYVFMENCVVVGRGLNYGNAYEWALKLMETCYVVAERFSSADFFHGPLAIVERRFPVMLFSPQGVAAQSNLDLLKRLKDLHADSFSITNDQEIAALSSRTLLMPPEITEFLSPIPFIVPAQLFAALLAEAKGLNPDAPRSLSKVTTTI